MEDFDRITLEMDLALHETIPDTQIEPLGKLLGNGIAEFLMRLGYRPVHVIVQIKGGHLPASYADPEAN